MISILCISVVILSVLFNSMCFRPFIYLHMRQSFAACTIMVFYDAFLNKLS